MASDRERQVEDFCSRIPCAGCGHPESPLGSHDCYAWRRRELEWKRIHFALPPEAEAKAKETKQFFDALQTAAQTAARTTLSARGVRPSASSGDSVTVTQVITGS